LNCEILGKKLYLKGPYRDIQTISAITENGTALTAVAAYGDNNSYFIDKRLGVLLRNDQNWSLEAFAIAATGTYGLVSRADGTTVLGDIKQAVIEMSAAKSGLWKVNVSTEGGDILTIRTTPSQQTLDIIKKYTLRDV
jgi:hypothetical protein